MLDFAPPAQPQVLSGTTDVLQNFPSETPVVKERPPVTVPPAMVDFLLVFAAAVFAGAMVWIGERWRLPLTDVWPPAAPTEDDAPFWAFHPLLVLVKLMAAVLIGLLVTLVARQARHSSDRSFAMDQAQTLLCVSGAIVMIIIGDSVARAFGIAGAAAIIRFRTPVEDPRDITILFLLMALGMATGLGAFSLAGLGTLFLCLLLVGLLRADTPRHRSLTVEIVAAGPEFPTDAVRRVFEQHRVAFEPREVAAGEPARTKFQASIDRGASIDRLSHDLLHASPDIRSVNWQSKKAG